MPLIEWRPQLETGLSEIDSQHRELVDMINELSAHSMLEADNAVIEAALNRLVDYASFHFSLEETLMKEAAYSDFAGHRSEHASFALEVMRMSSRAFEGEVAVGDITEFLKKWLIKHIMTIDMHYVDCLKKHGVP